MAAADVDGDGATDLVWNHLSGNENHLYVGLGGRDGRLRIRNDACAGKPCTFSGSQPWGQYELVTGDFNGDGRDDLLWVPKAGHLPQLGYTLYLLATTEDGFEAEPTLHMLAAASTSIEGTEGSPLVADMDADGLDDLVFRFVTRNASNQTQQDFQILRATGDAQGAFDGAPRRRAVAATDYDYPDTALYFAARDIDSDGTTDLLWGLLGHQISTEVSADDRNTTLFALNDALDDDPIAFPEAHRLLHGGREGWSNYLPLYEDFDGDGDLDLAWVRRSEGQLGAVHQASFDVGAFVQGPLQWWQTGEDPAVTDVLQGANLFLETADVNGDAPRDAIATSFLPDPNDASGPLVINVVATMKGLADGPSGLFNVSISPQTHPVQQDWSAYTHRFIGDFNGDGLEDLLWNDPALDNSVFVALAKRDTLN